MYTKATPQAIWDAITQPEWSQRYGYGGSVEFDLRPGGKYMAYTSDAMKKSGVEQGFQVPDIAVDGEVIEVDPPHKLVQTWRMLMMQGVSEGFTRLTYDISEGKGGVSKLTVTHELEGAPQLAVLLSGGMEDMGAGGGWSWVLSDLKTLLETGSSLNAEDPLRG